MSDEAETEAQGETAGQEVRPAEDLMREHGVLNRVLLIYDESGKRLVHGAAETPVDVIADAAALERRLGIHELAQFTPTTSGLHA